ncbi:MAG: dihydrolipoamide acetyltransferase family protein [Acidimicrobiia bacterium]
MAKEFRLPDIGEGLTEAEVVRWVIPVGGTVDVDETVVELETDKAVVEIPSPYGGVVLHHGAAEGEVIEVGDVLVVVGEAGEEWAEATPGGVETAPEAEEEVESDAEVDDTDGAEPSRTETAPEPAPIVGTLSERAEELPVREETARPSTTSVKALPLVRKMAREMGVDLTAVTGSGPDGRVTRDDVISAAQHSGVEPSAPSVTPVPSMPTPPVATVPAGERPAPQRRQLSKLRRTIAANMSASWSEIPHVTTFDEVDATRLMAMREALGRRHEVRIPMEALVVKAVTPVLTAFPEFNASLEGEELVLHSRQDIGIAVDTPDGLLVAVIRNADRRSVLALAQEVRRLGGAARERKLGADELRDQTFTVSNIGALGGGFGTPIVPPGTAAILSVGRVTDRPVVRDGRVEIAPVMPVSLSYDHRIIDGGLGRRFMAMLLENLEEPGLFLVD